jgi:hypothetical protein
MVKYGEGGSEMSATKSSQKKTGTAVTGERLLSLGGLRGFDMFWIIGGDELASRLLERSASPEAAKWKLQLEHVEWEGF